MDGAIIVDKPEGMTSHDVVNRLRRLSGTRKIGHLGTLDPLATGVLPLLIGRATRLAQFFSPAEKKYAARIRFGWATDTYDREGTPVSQPVEPNFSREQLETALNQFRGTFLQTPPPFSAKKIAGTPAYKLARKNIPVELSPVEVRVFELNLDDFDGASTQIRVHCSAGTYVRGIAHDIGQQLHCGAFLESLRRTASGEFTEDRAHSLDDLAKLSAAGGLVEALIPAARLLPQFSSAAVDVLTVGQIRQGKDFRLSPFLQTPASKYVKAISQEGDLVAIGEARLPHLYHPILVL
ncbi:MAG TPA: tRNA pseudouridine(55) synthase TruB [Bryobacteraceae bacterium]|nr:tRNA pseudouridine(55) synthase TruB [Bryobacteraceae bacterium]